MLYIRTLALFTRHGSFDVITFPSGNNDIDTIILTGKGLFCGVMSSYHKVANGLISQSKQAIFFFAEKEGRYKFFLSCAHGTLLIYRAFASPSAVLSPF